MPTGRKRLPITEVRLVHNEHMYGNVNNRMVVAVDTRPWQGMESPSLDIVFVRQYDARTSVGVGDALHDFTEQVDGIQAGDHVHEATVESIDLLELRGRKDVRHGR
jgi:hypothetical protein